MMEYIKAGRLLARQTRIYVSDLLPLAQETFQATLTALYLLLRLLIHLLRPFPTLLLNLSRVAAPTIRQASHHFWTIFCRQPPRLLALEAFLTLLILLLLLLEHRFGFLRSLYRISTSFLSASSRKYRILLTQVRTKSRLAASLLPHLTYLLLAIFTHISLGPFIEPFAHGPNLLLLVCARPVVRTVLLLYSVDIDPVQPHPTDRQDDNLAPSDPTPHNPIAQPVQRAASVPTAAVRRRRRSKGGDADATDVLRTRARDVAREIENDGGDALNDARRVIRVAETVSVTPDGKREGEKKEREGRKRTSFTQTDEQAARRRIEESMLRFWVVFGAGWAGRAVAWYFCPDMFEGVVQRLDVVLVYGLIWAQLAFTDGARLAYRVVVGVVRRRGTGREEEASALKRLNVGLRLAVAMGVLRDERAHELADVTAESGLALVGVVFLVTPRMATYLGTVLLGIVLPAYASAGVLEVASDVGRRNWLTYWPVLAAVEMGYGLLAEVVGWVPLWYHAKVVLLLWLQLPFYRGAGVVLDRVMGRVGTALSTVRRQAVTPRKRKWA